jgi:hypothetical protein
MFYEQIIYIVFIVGGSIKYDGQFSNIMNCYVGKEILTD